MSGPTAYSVLVSIDDEFVDAVDGEWIEGVARRALVAEKVVAGAELGVLVTGDEAVRRLNREYAGEDEVTDVLSFSLREGEEFAVAPEAAAGLGEVIIAYPTAERQAALADRLVLEEVSHLLIHGILHLLGYDHAASEEERLMRAKEQALLRL